MGTHKIGKLKFNFSKDGLAFRFGDGDIRRLNFGKKAKEEAPEYEEDVYAEDAYGDAQDGGRSYDPGAYSGRFAASDDAFYDDEDQGVYEDEYDDYDDRAYDEYEEGEYDDRYDDRYADEYDDEYEDSYDDRYEDGEYDDGYYDEDGEYDDRYLDEDADGYAEAPYAEGNAILRYADENDWVTYVLLFLLPPLGIYLLWRRGRFDTPIRWGISAASAIWFIIVIILLFSAIFGGSGDKSSLVLNTPSPTPPVEGTPTPGPGTLAASDPTNEPVVNEPSATPVGSAQTGTQTGNNSTTADTVVMPATGLYYHKNSSCSEIEDGISLSNVTLAVATARGKSPCPVCYPDQTQYYCRDDSTWYHTDPNCTGMQNASAISEDAALAAGKTACPVCVLKTALSLADGELRFATSSTTDKSGITVYATKNGKYFHTANCPDVSNAVAGSLLDAMLVGKTACPTCCKSAGKMVWATEGGFRYHNNSGCDGMKNAVEITVAEALVLGKDKCHLCWGDDSTTTTTTTGTTNTGSTTTNTTQSLQSVTEPVNDGTVYVYGTPNGQNYHTDPTCRGMTGAQLYTLKSMILAGRPACSTCCESADMTVFASRGGTYYHSYATCSDMTQAVEGTLADALAYGYKKCPYCWNGTDSSQSQQQESASTGTLSGETSSSDSNYVYCTIDGTWYHTNSTCSGMKGASRVTLETAIRLGKTACSECAAAAAQTVYSTEKGTWYHVDPTCTSMKNAKAKTIEEALLLGQTACPTCIGGSGSTMQNSSSGNTGTTTELVSSGIFTVGTSDIKVYATADGKYFHTTDSCTGELDVSYITLETALNYGKTGCPKCSSTANTTVYALKGGKYYHFSKTCAGSGAASGTRAEALAYGFDPCPYCVTQTKELESSNVYKAGTSKLKVYASVSGKYYHADQTCAGNGASYITLETALNYSKTPCPSCAAIAGKTVYSSLDDNYYHSSKACAGSGASSGNFAQALALGKKECPNCIAGSESYEVSDIEYAAPADTPVYIDLDGELLYYHNASRCSDAGFSSGTKVTLEFALDMYHKACPFCNPPTEVE